MHYWRKKYSPALLFGDSGVVCRASLAQFDPPDHEHILILKAKSLDANQIYNSPK